MNGGLKTTFALTNEQQPFVVSQGMPKGQSSQVTKEALAAAYTLQ
jgi:hypothetical protein